MKPKLALRLAAFLVLFFVVGHSIGHFTRKQVSDPQAKAVLKQMEEHRFPIGSQWRTYDEFYTGMSVNLIISLLTLALFLWFVSNRVNESPEISRQLLYPILFCLTGFTVTGFLFFFLVPAITCLLASGLILYTLLRLHKQPIRVRSLTVV